MYVTSPHHTSPSGKILTEGWFLVLDILHSWYHFLLPLPYWFEKVVLGIVLPLLHIADLFFVLSIPVR